MTTDNEELELIMMDLEEKTEKTVSVLKGEYASIRAGRANPHILDKVLVDYYGTPSPINQVGSVSVADATSIVISPWDVSMLKAIEKAILAANIGLTPVNNGKVLRLNFPPLTEERRKDIVKQVKKTAEDAKVAVRNIRRDAMDAVKKMKTAKTLSEDEAANAEKEIERTVEGVMTSVEKIAAEKEKDVLTV